METVALIQGIYYLVTGSWAVLHISSFEKLTGPKTDKWLVKMIGLLAAVIGLIILLDYGDDSIRLLAILSAASFMLIDIFYSARNVISNIYLFDAAANIIFIVGWLLA